ncbi:MAG: tetratricopeptide repeat protein [Pseudomonadota bacterium]
MTREELLRHATLSDDCKEGFLSSVKSTLDKQDINICYDRGAFFFNALRNQDLELLLLLLDHANRSGVNKKKLAQSIASANERVLRTSEEAKEIIAPYLAMLEGSEESEGTTMDATTSKSSSIEACIYAAKIGDVDTIRQHLDIGNRNHKLMIISTAIQHEQEGVITVLVDMAVDKKKAATVMRAAGDICTKQGLFQKAEEYYDKSLKLHPKYYVTYSKLGALYQHWSHECTDEDSGSLIHKAIERYKAALDHKPSRIKYREIQEKVDTINKQLDALKSVSSSEDHSDRASDLFIDDLLAYSSGEDTDTEDVVTTGASSHVHIDAEI